MQRNYSHIVVLTGAGISAESGLSTFRDEDGLWCQHRIEDVATPEAFDRNPELVQKFYNARRRQLSDVIPNAAHKALADLEKHWHGNFLLVTQNVDDLHQRAGSGSTKNPNGTPRFIAMHGELLKARCLNTNQVQAWQGDINEGSRCDCCNQPGTLRPHIVWFGEMPLMMQEISATLSQCDLFLSIGTSGTVYPAAGFVMEALQAGAHTVELNLEPSSGISMFDEAYHGHAATIIPQFVKELLA